MQSSLIQTQALNATKNVYFALNELFSDTNLFKIKFKVSGILQA